MRPARTTGRKPNSRRGSVTALGDTHQVVASQAVLARNGMQLIERGGRVDSSLREKLQQHKLVPAIDQCLTVAGSVTFG